MKQIELTQGKYALIDDEDFELVSNYKWRFAGEGYAVGFKYLGKVNGKFKSDAILMHRIINKTPKGFVTDHINRNKLDNRKVNLRTVDRSLNAFNTGIYKHNKSGFTGISWSLYSKKWLARIQKNGKVIHLGLFNDIEKAVQARKQAEEIYAT